MLACGRISRSVLLRAVLGVVVSATVVPGAAAQDVPEAIQKLFEKTVRFDRALTWDEAHTALGEIESLTPDGKRLSPAAGRMALLIETHAALGVGNVDRAQKAIAKLRGEAAAAPEALRTSALVALAVGSAPIAAEAIEKAARVDETASGRVDRDKRALAAVGRSAPAATLALEGSGSVQLTPRRGAALLLEFWSVKDSAGASAGGKPEPGGAMMREDEAFAALVAEYETEPAVDVLGVNSDPRGDLASARRAAEARKLANRQHYEQAQGKPALREALGIGPGRSVVVIDSRGFVRAAGSAEQVGLQYALRAAVAEARGEFAWIAPVDLAGKAAVIEGAVADRAPAAKKPPAAGEKPSNSDAEAKLRQAHALRRTGHKTRAREMYQEIIRDYPGTVQAEEAERFLEDIGP